MRMNIEDWGRKPEESKEVKENRETLKRSQRFLDDLITKLIPEDSELLRVIPDYSSHAKDPTFIARIMEGLVNNRETARARDQKYYEMSQRLLSPDLNFSEAEKIVSQSSKNYAEGLNMLIQNRVFVEDKVLHYYDTGAGKWEILDMRDGEPVTTWNKLPVYQFKDGRFFVVAPMKLGAVLARGEGKKREYFLNEGDKFLQIGQYGVSFDDYRINDKVGVHLGGLVVDKPWYRSSVSFAEYIQEYTYYPTGSLESRIGKVVEGITATAISIEYGKDEWDKPVRVFQDIIQNHIDASFGQGGVGLTYEVDREGIRMWVGGG